MFCGESKTDGLDTQHSSLTPFHAQTLWREPYLQALASGPSLKYPLRNL